MPAWCEARAASTRRREFGDRDAEFDGFVDVIRGRIVVAGEDRAGLPGERDELAAVPVGVARVQVDALADELVDLETAHRYLARVEAPPGREIAELALTRRVVHQRHQVDRIARGVVFRLFEDVGRGDLAAKMGPMLGAQVTRCAGGGERAGERDQILADLGRVGVGADAERIEDRGDAGRGNLRVIGHHRAERVPADMRPRREMAFEMIGMQLDHAGDHGIPGHVVAVLRRRAFAEIDDQPLIDREPAMLDHPVGQDQPRIRQDEAIVVHRPVPSGGPLSRKPRDVDEPVGEADRARPRRGRCRSPPRPTALAP